MSTKALPYAPIETLLAARRHEGDGEVAVMAEAMNVTTRTLCRWKTAGVVPFASADKAAIALHLHPAIIWGDDYFDGIDK